MDGDRVFGGGTLPGHLRVRGWLALRALLGSSGMATAVISENAIGTTSWVPVVPHWPSRKPFAARPRRAQGYGWTLAPVRSLNSRRSK